MTNKGIGIVDEGNAKCTYYLYRDNTDNGKIQRYNGKATTCEYKCLSAKPMTIGMIVIYHRLDGILSN